MNYYLYGSLLILYLLSVLLTAIYNHTFDHTHFTGNLDGTVESERGGNEGHRNKKFAPIKHKSSSLFQNQDISDQDGFRHHQQNIKIIEEISNNNNININENTSRVQRKLKSIEPSCQKKYPESCYIYPYIKYWSHEFSERDCYVSPTKMEVRNTRSLNNNNNDHKEHKYLVFRHDSGGWNNIRCAFESIVVFAVASGRTLVLPPKERWAWLDQNQEHENNLSDFYTFVNLKKLEGILHIISMEEFLNITAKRGLLRMLPPDDVMVPHDTGQLMHLVLWKYLYEACFVWTDYNPADAFFEFALRYDAKSKELLFGHITESTIRFAKFLEHWKRIPYLYNETIHNEIAIFFPASRRDGTYRETATFYRYIYFEDPNVDATMKRIIRDRTHYNDEIMCAAGRIVKALLEESSAKFRKPLQEGKSYNSRSHGSNQTESRFTHATYHAMHVRHRDEFAAQNQYNQLLPDSIFNFALRHFDRNISTIIYIAVDSDNMTVFEPLREIFQLKFISDYMTQFEDGRSESMINYNHIGMVEQMICANADTFIGTMTSTYSDYIMRLRGYYDDDRVTRSYVFFSEIDFTHQYRSHDYLLNTPEGYTNIDAKDLVDVSTHSTRAPADKRGDDDDGMDLNPDEEDDDYDKTLSFMPSVSKRVKDYHDDTVE